MEKKTIVITGGAGFIGSHTANLLSEKTDYEIHVIDNLSTGRIENLNKTIKFHKIDLLNLPDLKSKIIDLNPTIVYHFATSCSVSLSEKNPIDDAHNNITTTLNLIESLKELAKKNILKNLVVASSQTTYGEGLYHCNKCKLDIKPLFRKPIDIKNQKFGGSYIMIRNTLNFSLTSDTSIDLICSADISLTRRMQ